jgi:hypothetical protein
MKCFLDGNAKSRTMGLVLSDESKKLHIGSVKTAAYSPTDAIQSKVIHINMVNVMKF